MDILKTATTMHMHTRLETKTHLADGEFLLVVVVVVVVVVVLTYSMKQSPS